jgi:hypothetical protein
MTPLNMARHRNNPYMAFWRMIKEGNDHFEVTKAEPHVDVCDKRYVFDARAPANGFHPREKCPAYEIPEQIATAVKAKEASDERAFTEHVNRGVATVAVKTGTDGGMHPVFLAKLQSKAAFDFQNASRDVKAPSGPLPANINPPRAPEPEVTAFAAPASSRTAQPTESNSTLRTIGKWFGLGGSEPTAPATSAAAPAAAKPKPAPTQTTAALKPATAPTPASKPQPKPQTEIVQAPSQAALPQAGSQPAAPSPPPQQQATPSPAPTTAPDLMAGASPVVPSGSFEGRWNAAR